MTPVGCVMNPDPMPERVCVPPPCALPKKKAKGSTGVRKTDSVCTVTTAGATRATASVMAERRDSATWVLRSWRAATPCAEVCDGVAPSQASRRTRQSGVRLLAVIVGDEVHVSVLKALTMLGLGRERVTRVPAADPRLQIDVIPGRAAEV